MKKTIALSLGSNIQRYKHINAGLTALSTEFGDIKCSPVYESDSVGFDGNAFLNLIVLIDSALPLLEVISILKRIEDDCGRDRSGPKFSPRTLDIDVVTFGDLSGDHDGVLLPREELFSNAFVLLPMFDLLPDHTVPGSKINYRELWNQFDKDSQRLWQVPFRSK